ncbi:MAG: hypothetical protein ACRERR_03095 [Moraxellaceae bacterium]
MSELEYRMPVWWGRFDFAYGNGRQWDLAGLRLGISRQPQEWQCWTQRSHEQSEDKQEWQQSEGNALAETQTALTRHVFRQTGEHLQLLPRLADRSVVVRPVSTLFLPANQSTTFYVSTPVWVAGYADDVVAPLFDLPVVIPRDTWFGPSPVRGQLCYATQVMGRTTLSQVSPRPFRAVTAVHVNNRSNDSLPIERISIPTPFLPVYAAQSGHLWTPALTVTREAHSQQLRIHIDSGIGTEAGHVQMLTPARRGTDEHTLIRVFDNFFD